jgi:osmotically inducible protein OsmC
MTRSATAQWQGTGKEGSGTLTAPSGVLSNTAYSFVTRFEKKDAGTSPEELLAAAHAACFTMKLSFELNAAGFTADNLETECAITLDNGAISTSALKVTAKVPQLDAAQFQEIALKAKNECPVSKLYNCATTLDASMA